MNYAAVRDRTLMLLNQYSVAGVPVADTYNNQQDYLNRIPALVDDAVMEIATTARKIPAVVELDSLEREEGEKETRYTLPADFFQLVSGSLVTGESGETVHTNLYTLEGRKYLIVPRGTENCRLTYYRYPVPLGDAPADGEELDNEPDTHYAVPYYAAAFLAGGDDPWLSGILYNKFEDKLRKLSPGRTAELHPAGDSYGFFG